MVLFSNTMVLFSVINVVVFQDLVAFHQQSLCFKKVSSYNFNVSNLWDEEALNFIFVAA